MVVMVLLFKLTYYGNADVPSLAHTKISDFDAGVRTNIVRSNGCTDRFGFIK